MRFPKVLQRRLGAPPGNRTRLLLVVEGRHDVAFLRTLSRTLHAADSSIPDLAALEDGGELVLLPFRGGDALAWADRLASLRIPELVMLMLECDAEGESGARQALWHLAHQ